MPKRRIYERGDKRKAAENNILFVQVQNRFKEGKQVYRFGNLNVYIDRNVVFMLQNGSWIPASINEILQKALWKLFSNFGKKKQKIKYHFN